MMKNKNKGKKTLTAVSALVAAGLTPGILAAAPAGMPIQGEVTAAQVVAIGDNAYSFDELYAMQSGNGASPQRPQRPERPQRPNAYRYGAPHPTSYGVPRPQQRVVVVTHITGLDTIQMALMQYCVQLADADVHTRGVNFSIDSDFSRKIGFKDYQLKELQAEVKRRYGVELSYHRLYLVGQLNTVRLLSEYIYKLKTVWD